VNAFDVAVVVLGLGAVVGGYRMGFVARVASWLGLGVGLVVAAILAPWVLDALPASVGELGRALVAVGVFLVVASLTASVGELVGFQLRRRIPLGGLRQVDHVAGAGAGALGLVVILWLLVPTLAEVPGDLSRLVRGSVAARLVDRATPRVPAALQALRDQVSRADFPEVFDRLTPAPRTGIPPPSGAIPADVEARVVGSTVQLAGEACGRLLQGSGFVVEPGVVMTNAHVVAGVDDPRITRPDGRELAATVVVYDAERDLALLTVPGLGQPPLPAGQGDVGDAGAVFGHPRGQVRIEVSPARIEDEVSARGRDIYGRRITVRQVFILAAALEPGDSGAALVDEGGAVVGVAFAVAPDAPATAYALTWDEAAAVLAEPRAEVDTGACLR